MVSNDIFSFEKEKVITFNIIIKKNVHPIYYIIFNKPV